MAGSLLATRAAAAETEFPPPPPSPSTKLPPVDEVDETNEFTALMEEAGVKHQVRLASGARGRGKVGTLPSPRYYCASKHIQL
jgi:hypothetical protein